MQRMRHRFTSRHNSMMRSRRRRMIIKALRKRQTLRREVFFHQEAQE